MASAGGPAGQSYAAWDPFADPCAEPEGRTPGYADLNGTELAEGPGLGQQCAEAPAGGTAEQSFADWDPFADAFDAPEGQTTEYADSGGGDWDPFAAQRKLELAGDLAMESDDVEAIEAWIEQARAALFPWEKIIPKDNRLRELKWRREDLRKRKVVKERLDAAMRGNDWARLRETIGDAARAGVAHPTQLRAAALQLQSLRGAEADYFRRKDILDTAKRDEENEAIAELASEKLWRKALVPSLDVEVTDEERGALEWVLCRPRPRTMQVRLCFPSGEEEVVEVPASANAAALLTALVPVRQRHRIPQNLALFSPSGDLLLFDRPLHAQGVRSGSTVRVDDRELGSQRPAAVTGSASSSGRQLAVVGWARGQSWGRAASCPGKSAAAASWAALGVLTGQLPAGVGRGDASCLARYAALALSTRRQRLPPAICEGPVAAEVVQEEESDSSAILEWMREYWREVVLGEAPRSSGAEAGPDAVFQEWEQAVEAEAEARLEEEDWTRVEVDECWVHVYWPLSYAKPALSDFREELRKHAEVVVIGWNAAGDKEIMDLSLNVCGLARAGYFLATGDEPPAEGSMPGRPVKSSFLRLPTHAESRELGREVHKSLREAGVGDSKALVVVSRTYQSRRIALSLDFFRGPQPPRPERREDRAKTTLAIIPYCLEPQESVLQDCMDRKVDILIEAQLLVEMDPHVLNSNATEALSELLKAFPTPKRPNWEGGVLRRQDGKTEPTQAEETEEEEVVQEALDTPTEEEERPRAKEAVEFMDNDDDVVSFSVNDRGGLDYSVNGQEKLFNITTFRIVADRVLQFKGTAAPGSSSENWRVTVKVGQEPVARRVEDLFLKR